MDVSLIMHLANAACALACARESLGVDEVNSPLWKRLLAVENEIEAMIAEEARR